MATPPASLEEQQLRFVAAQHLMAVPSQRRSAATPDAQPQRTVHLGNVAEGDASRKRGRRSNSRKAAQMMTSPPLRPQQHGDSPAQTPRKSAYAIQKQQRDDLVEQVAELEEQVEQLRLQVGLPTKADRRAILAARRANAEVDEKIHANRRYVTQLRSLVAEQLQSPPVNPLATHIHLPRDQEQRRAILHGMKDVKLRRAAEIGIERFRHLDGNLSYLSEERFGTDDGAHHCNRWEINAFRNFKTARQLYDALLFFIYNMEISVTEMVNQIAVREDDQDIEPTIWNHRIVTTTEDVGCVEELNFVGFAQFYESCDLVDGAPLGVITYCSVDVDDLYPYKPLERTCKEVQTFHLFCEVVDPETHTKSVVLKTCLLNAQLPPQFPLEPGVLEKLHAYMSRWIVLMNQYLSEYTVAP